MCYNGMLVIFYDGTVISTDWEPFQYKDAILPVQEDLTTILCL